MSEHSAFRKVSRSSGLAKKAFVVGKGHRASDEACGRERFLILDERQTKPQGQAANCSRSDSIRFWQRDAGPPYAESCFTSVFSREPAWGGNGSLYIT